MKIVLSPMRREDRLTLERQGDALIINGERFDFGPLPEGATLPCAAISCDWLASDVRRIDGVIQLTLILPHGANAPEATRFPAPISAHDGPIALPDYEIIEEVEE